jgi:hypothetical protein
MIVKLIHTSYKTILFYLFGGLQYCCTFDCIISFHTTPYQFVSCFIFCVCMKPSKQSFCPPRFVAITFIVPDTCKRVLRRVRAQHRPREPQTLQELDIDGAWSMTTGDNLQPFHLLITCLSFFSVRLRTLMEHKLQKHDPG